MKHIETKKGLSELLKRYKEAFRNGNDEAKEWIPTINGCIAEGLAMDELDFENTESKELRRLWKGLK